MCDNLSRIVLSDMAPHIIFCDYILHPLYANLVGIESRKIRAIDVCGTIAHLVKLNGKNFSDEILTYADKILTFLQVKCGDATGEEYLRKIIFAWEQYNIYMKFACAGSRPPQTNERSMFAKCCILFKERIFISEKMKNTVCELVDTEMVQCRTMMHLITTIGYIDEIKTIMSMSAFQQINFSVSPPIVKQLLIDPYCEIIKQRTLKMMDATVYLCDYIDVMNVMLYNIASKVMDPICNPAKNTVIKTLLDGKINDLIDRDFPAVLRKYEDSSITNMGEITEIRDLFTLVSGSEIQIELLVSCFLKWSREFIKNIVVLKDNGADIESIDELAMRCKKVIMAADYYKTIRRDNNRVIPIIRAELSSIENMPLYIADYIDWFMKRREEDEEKKEIIIDRIVTLFSNISNKDITIDSNKKKLSVRLLDNKTIVDTEGELISKFTMLVGKNAMTSSGGMLTDIKRGLFATYNGAIDFDVLLLTGGRWTFPQIQCLHQLSVVWDTLSAMLSADSAVTEELKMKKLYPIMSAGYVELVYCCNGGKKFVFKMAPIQASTLLLFNEVDELSVESISKQLNVDMNIALRVIHPLTLSDKTKRKCAVLEKSDKTTSKLLKTESLKLNLDYTSLKRMIEFPMASLEIAPKDGSVEEDRRFLIDSVVVRIMKARKEMSHADIMSELISNINTMGLFSPEPVQLKRRIEHLIDREYLERIDGGYKYVA